MSVYTIPDLGPSDLLTSQIELARRLKTSTTDSFSGAGASGLAYARTLPVTIAANSSYSAKLQKNANVAVRFIRAEGLYIEAVDGDPSGGIVALASFISTNAVMQSDFAGSVEIYDNAATGLVVLGAQDELKDSFYPDGQFTIELRNITSEPIETFLSVGVEQLTSAGVYSILEPNTQLEPSTEMSDYNGNN